MAARTSTATMFCSAMTSAHSAPSSGHESTACTSPPVTMLAVPIPSSRNPQKIAMCISPAGRSRYMRVCTSPYRMPPQARRKTWSVGVAFRTAAKTRRWRAVARAKNSTAP